MNPLQRLIGFISQPDHKRTLSILAALAILAAIPLTVYIAQQQQDIRQRASDQCECKNGSWQDNGSGDCFVKGLIGSCQEAAPTPSTDCPSGKHWDSIIEQCVDDRGPTPTPRPVGGGGNYCTAASYYPCTVGVPQGNCQKDGKTCTAYSTYKCNYGGQNYCDNSNCDNPCTTGGGTPPTPTPGVGGPPPSPVPTSPPTGSYPKGVHDVASCTVIQGWSCDPDNYSQPLEVSFFKMDGEPGSGADYLGTTIANQEREQGVGNECGGNRNHGFTFSTPDRVKDGQPHRIWAYVKDLGSNLIPPLTNTPKTITCQATSPTPTTIARLPADVNGDGRIDILDFNIWFQAIKTGSIPQNTYPDINSDGRIDILDFNIWYNAVRARR